jgi:type VI protein secretion system component Hcp
MALNTYLHLQLNGVAVTGSVTQTGRVGLIEVNSLEWSFDSDGNIGEIKFLSDIDKATVPIGQGLKSAAVVDALFDFWTPATTSGGGSETKYYTLHGTNGRVTSASLWMMNNQDPTLTRYSTAMQYTMSFAAIEQTWIADGAAVTLP